MPALSLVLLHLLSFSFLLPTVLPCCTHRQEPPALSPWPSWAPVTCSDGFAFLVAVETREGDEKPGPSVGLWAGLGAGQWLFSASWVQG